MAILLQTPGRGEVPPLGAVEYKIEAGASELKRVLERTSERFGEEHRAGRRLLDLADQAPPQLVRHFVRRVAAKAVEASRGVQFCEVDPVAPESLAVGTRGVVDFVKVAPRHPPVAVLGSRMHRLAVGPSPVPFGMLAHERRVERGMIDHEIHHQAHSRASHHGGDRAYLLFRRAARRLEHPRVDRVVVLNRVEASRVARLLNRIDKYPVEVHLAGALNVCTPLRHRPRQQREEIVYSRSFGPTVLAHFCHRFLRRRRVLRSVGLPGSPGQRNVSKSFRWARQLVQLWPPANS